ncbi:MAG: hypothetical protein KH232_01635 [Streptococcus salivarius]|nr:hypothetical protein [Streptococcus salivarius]
MNQKDWIEYFEEINGRKPTPQEFVTARAAREFVSDNPKSQQMGSDDKPTQVNQLSVNQSVNASAQQITQPDTPTFESMYKVPKPQKTLSKKTKTIVFSILGVVTAIILIVSGYSLWRYQSGKIASGVYEVVSSEYYDKDKKKWRNYKEEMGEYGEVLDFIVIKGNSYKYNYFTKSDSTSYVLPENYDSDMEVMRILPWRKQIIPFASLSEYKNELHKFKSKYPEYVDDNFDASKNYKEVLKLKILYRKEGDSYTEKSYDENGKLFSKVTFRRLSKEASKKRLGDYDKAVEEDKKERQEDSEDK